MKLSFEVEKALDNWLNSDTWQMVHPFDDKLWLNFASCISRCKYSFDQEELIQLIAYKAIEKGAVINREDLENKNSYMGLAGVIRDRVESLY